MNINAFVMDHEITIRLGSFFGVFVVMALWERLAPRRALTVSKALRWASNLGIVLLNTLLLRLLFGAAAVGVALFARDQAWGLLNYFDIAFAFAVVVSIIVLDFAIYLQHIMFHAVPALWRLHRMHHADLDFDVTTGARFHPIEIILSMFIKFAVIIVLGAPVLAVVVFEVLLNATSMFNHSNVYIPRALDWALRWFVVTPEMHRVHHSIEDDETNSNFGFNLPWWDRVCGTYRDQPRAGHEGMTIGIRTFRDVAQCQSLPRMLLMPFIGKVTGYAINRRTWSRPDEQR
jgi:sterol desaturase/sphingolipid hydroxylase (fatty acid hydroxylase superfamily)